MRKLAAELEIYIPTSFFEADGPHFYNSLAMIDASGAGNPSPVDAGYGPFSDNPVPRAPVALYLLLAGAGIVSVPVLLERLTRGGPAARPPAAA